MSFKVKSKLQIVIGVICLTYIFLFLRGFVLFHFFLHHSPQAIVGTEPISISQPSPQSKNHTSDEPFVLLHVGPHKTGTTSLQMLISIEETKLILLKDNYRVPNYEDLPHGTSLFQTFAHCHVHHYRMGDGKVPRVTCELLLQNFTRFLEDAHSKGQNVMIVSEDMDRTTINYDRLKKSLRPYTSVRIVAFYRRLHDWLPSWYNQIVKMYTPYYANGDKHYPSFVEWVQEQFDNFLLVHTFEVVHRYKNHSFDQVDVMNFHDGDVVDTFFCKGVPNAHNACKSYREGKLRNIKSNAGESLDWERLAIEVCLNGKIPFNITRKLYATRISKTIYFVKEKYNITDDVVPKLCPPQTLLEKIYDLEVKQEEAFFPEWFSSQGGKEGLRASFEKAAKDKFCSLDVKEIFRIGLFDTIFRKLQTCPFDSDLWKPCGKKA